MTPLCALAIALSTPVSQANLMRDFLQRYVSRSSYLKVFMVSIRLSDVGI